MDEGLTIAEVAESTGLTAHTLRYYERAGLLDPPPRGMNGHRRYGRRDLDRIHLLTRLRSTGMPIAELRRYVELIRDGDATAGERRQVMIDHRAKVEEQIKQLTEDLALIDYKISIYTEVEEKHARVLSRDGSDEEEVA
ncbi:MerR family transcriptional regulator [Actinocorallia longicatena]|uniref:MerR family transcriptional regulator n=1 Tax=Actinocorallia longicatena TaxID=111803 RepID=A0ABP6Q6Q3_9ACTN